MPNNSKKVERAQLFLSFDSLKGFKNLLSQKERIVVDKKDLSIDDYEELNWKIKQITPGQMIHIVYFDQNDYVSLEGMVTKIDLELNKFIRIVDKNISLTQIVKISSEQFDIS